MQRQKRICLRKYHASIGHVPNNHRYLTQAEQAARALLKQHTIVSQKAFAAQSFQRGFEKKVKVVISGGFETV